MKKLFRVASAATLLCIPLCFCSGPAGSRYPTGRTGYSDHHFRTEDVLRPGRDSDLRCGCSNGGHRRLPVFFLSGSRAIRTSRKARWAGSAPSCFCWPLPRCCGPFSLTKPMLRKTQLHWLLCWLCLLMAVQEASAQENVNLYQLPQREVGITDEFTTPLSNRLGAFVTFVYVVCALLSVVGGLRIFSRWQTGDSDVTGDVLAVGPRHHHRAAADYVAERTGQQQRNGAGQHL